MNVQQDPRWEKCMKLFQDNVSPEHYRAWFEPLEYQGFEHNRILLHVPSLFFAEQIESKFYSLMSRAFERVFGTALNNRSSKWAIRSGRWIMATSTRN